MTIHIRRKQIIFIGHLAFRQWILLQESSGTVSYPLSATVLAMATGLNRHVLEPQAVGIYNTTPSNFDFNQVQQNAGNQGAAIAAPYWIVVICKN